MIKSHNNLRINVDKRIKNVNTEIYNYKMNPYAEMELLDSFPRYPEYSIRNILLAEAQNKGSFALKTADNFKKLGYSILKGQEAIVISLPNWEEIFTDQKGEQKLLKDANQDERAAILENKIQLQSVITHFKTISVYDITQTDCPIEMIWEKYPEKNVDFDFDYSAEDYECLEKSLVHYARTNKILIHYKHFLNSKEKNSLSKKNKVTIDSHSSMKKKVNRFIRVIARLEMSHHQRETNKNKPVKIMEFSENQKEMAAYLVSKSLGMDREEYQQKYLMSWREKNIEDDLYIQMLEEVKLVSQSLTNAIVEVYSNIKNRI